MAKFNVQEAQKYLSELIKRTLDGEEIVITQSGKPIARLVPILEERVATRIPGNDRGKTIIKPDFDEPLREFDE